MITSTRLATLIGVALAVLVVGPVVARPATDPFLATGGLTGRTHLIVKEPGIKRFTTGSLSPSPTVASHACFEVSRSGVVSATPYTVPAGKVLIITDVQVAGSPSTGAWLDTAEGVLGYAFGTGASDSIQTHLVGGLAMDPGMALAFLSFTTSGAPYVIRVLGYETEDVP